MSGDQREEKIKEWERYLLDGNVEGRRLYELAEKIVDRSDSIVRSEIQAVVERIGKARVNDIMNDDDHDTVMKAELKRIKQDYGLEE